MTLLALFACSPTATEDVLATPACELDGEHTVDWVDSSHSKKADPDYTFAFDRGSVMRVDITVAEADYTAMYEELATLLGGEFGAGGGMPGGGEGPPDGAPPEGGPPEGGEGGGDLSFASSDPSYVPANVTVDGATWCYAGMRFKGNSTLSQTWSQGIAKLPFRVDFDRFEDEHPEVEDQGFYGFSDLSFGNNMGDGTYVRDVMASTVLEDRGVPAARNRFVTVWLDAGEGPTYLGLYTMAEDPADMLTDRLWGDNDGNLYEGDGTCADLTCYDAESFAPKTNDEADGAEVQALVDALAADRSDAAAWRSQLESTLDMDAFLQWLAVNSAIENWDTYGAMSHNYYLYAMPGETRLNWIPWDHNLSLMDGFQGSSDPLLADLTEEWPLIRYTLDDPEYALTYEAWLEDALEGAYEPDTFAAAAEAHRALIEPYVVGADGELDGSGFVESEAAWAAAYEELYAHVDTRRSEVEAALE